MRTTRIFGGIVAVCFAIFVVTCVGALVAHAEPPASCQLNGTCVPATKVVHDHRVSESVEVIETNIVGSWPEDGRPFSYTPGRTALDKANHERRIRGYGPLIPDPQLQSLALKKARIAARRGIRGHVGGSLGGARAEGVGTTSGRFLSCCLDMRASYGGAAMVVGRRGRVYCCLLVR